jgi:hypothetical protein
VSNPITADDVQTLETIIDRVGLAELTDTIARIAREKAEHVQTNWQDRDLARVWNRVARRFDKLVPSLELVDKTLGQRKRGQS